MMILLFIFLSLNQLLWNIHLLQFWQCVSLSWLIWHWIAQPMEVKNLFISKDLLFCSASYFPPFFSLCFRISTEYSALISYLPARSMLNQFLLAVHWLLLSLNQRVKYFRQEIYCFVCCFIRLVRVCPTTKRSKAHWGPFRKRLCGYLFH